VAPIAVPKQRDGGSATAPQVQVIPAPPDGAVDAADEAVDLLLDTGRPPGEILVLTTGDAHPWAAHELTFGEASYWAQHGVADDVFYADINAPGATGRPVVVVAHNGGSDETMPRALASALARAGVLLIVCGDPARINSLLGASAYRVDLEQRMRAARSSRVNVAKPSARNSCSSRLSRSDWRAVSVRRRDRALTSDLVMCGECHILRSSTPVRPRVLLSVSNPDLGA